MNMAPCVAFFFREEGGFVDNPSDPGGCTYRGITLATLSAWRGTDCAPDDLRAMTVDEATAIYGARYWNAVRGGSLPAGVDLMVADHAANAGVFSSATLLQRLVKAAPDGHIGPQTMLAVGNVADVAGLVSRLHDAQHAYYTALPGFGTFGHGWLARLERRRAAATALIKH